MTDWQKIKLQGQLIKTRQKLVEADERIINLEHNLKMLSDEVAYYLSMRECGNAMQLEDVLIKNHLN